MQAVSLGFIQTPVQSAWQKTSGRRLSRGWTAEHCKASLSGCRPGQNIRGTLPQRQSRKSRGRSPPGQPQVASRPTLWRCAREALIAPQALFGPARPGREIAPSVPFESMAMWGKLKNT